MRSPRSRPLCNRTSTPSVRKDVCRVVACSSTGPHSASTAKRTALRMRRACRRAAPSAPRRGIRRVLTRPASGARAKTMTTVSALIGVFAGEALRRHAKRVEKPQPPHEEDRAHDAARLPAPAGGRDPLMQARGTSQAFHGTAERDVLHEFNLGKRAKGLTAHEDRL